MSNNPFDLSGQFVNSSQYPSLALAVSAASSGGFGLNVDKAWLNVPTQTISVKSVVFSGGSIQPASAGTVTINSPVSSGITQIFDLSLGGLIRGTMICPEVYPEWWGSTGLFIQKCLDYVATSTVRSQKVKLTGHSYTITQTLNVTGAAHPNIEGMGNYETILNFATTSEQPAFSVVGTEQYSAGSLSKLLITDPTNTVSTSGLIGLKMQTVVGFRFDFATGTAKRGVLWNNSNSDFAEFCTGILQSPTTTATAGEFRSAGTQSFHGSGFLAGTVINTLSGNPAILIGTNCKPYESPMDVEVFTWDNGATINATVIQNNSTSPLWFTGNIQMERFNSGIVSIAGGSNTYLIGNTSFLGDQTKLASGSLYLIESINDSKSGAPIIVFKPVNRISTVTTNSAVFSYPVGYNQYLMTIDVSGANYHYILVGWLTTDDVTGYTWTLVSTPTAQNGAGYGSPTITPGGGSVLTVSGSWGGNSIQVAVTFNQIGQGFAHHDN